MENLLDTTAWQNFSNLADQLGVQARLWLTHIETAALSLPWLAGLLTGLSLMAGLMARSLLLLLLGLFMTCLELSLIGGPGSNLPLIVGSGALCAHAILFLEARRWRHRVSSFRQQTAKQTAEMTELRLLLDREITWRTAAQTGPLPVP